MRIPTPFKASSTAALLGALLAAACSAPEPAPIDPLPSWAEGATRSAILQFVADVTEPGGPKYVPPEERIATFDNDGTLWCEQPVVQMTFAIHRIKAMASDHPEWKDVQPFKAVLEGDEKYLVDDLLKGGGHELGKILAVTNAGMPLDEFTPLVEEFLETVDHPRYDVPFNELAYLPMLELLEFLRAADFKTYLCSGGGADFMRAFSEETYGVVPENVIGTFALSTFEKVDGEWVIVKGTSNMFLNDKANKPVAISTHIGRIPILAAGNVRSGGDVEQLRYSQTNSRPSLQILVNHDDAEREFAYAEKDNASLNAAQENSWVVVSMKNDWLRVFPKEAPAVK